MRGENMVNKRKHPEYYAFPAVLEQDRNDGGVINVTFPDLENCFTNGATVEEALTEAKEALENVLYWMERDENGIPNPSDIRSIKCVGDQFSSLVVADMGAARRSWENRSVSRTITLPSWMDEMARQSNINFSQELQNAIKEKLQTDRNPKTSCC